MDVIESNGSVPSRSRCDYLPAAPGAARPGFDRHPGGRLPSCAAALQLPVGQPDPVQCVVLHACRRKASALARMRWSLGVGSGKHFSPWQGRDAANEKPAWGHICTHECIWCRG